MPKTASKPYKLHQYSSSDLHRALGRIKKGESFGKVAAEYSIPKSTLFAKYKEIIPIDARRGPATVLTAEEENRLKKWILDKAKLGFPMHADEVTLAVQKVLNEAQRKTGFTDNKPGKKWLKLFLKRHVEITEKQTEVISKGRASVTEDNLRAWFKEVKNYLVENNVDSVLNSPESIFNGDETGIQLCPRSRLLLGSKKEKDFYEIANGKEKESITVLFTFSAAGCALPPMIMFPCKRLSSLVADSVPDEWSVGRSDSGWMVSSTFYEYIANQFYPWCLQNKVQFPVIYFLDGHQSHLSLELSDFCKQNDIILISLYPNATHIIQPCDVAIFRALKYKWRQAVQQYKQETQVSLTKATFAPLLKKAYDQLSVETIKNGFRKCGLYPFDENNVDYNKCISSRRKSLNFSNPNKNSSSSNNLECNDFLSTKKFFDSFIDEEMLNKFIEIRGKNEICNDSVYLLWKICIDNLEILEKESNNVEKTTDQSPNSMFMQDSSQSHDEQIELQNLCSSYNAVDSNVNSMLEPTGNVTEVSDLSFNDGILPEVYVEDYGSENIPIIDISSLSQIEIINVDNLNVINNTSESVNDTNIVSIEAKDKLNLDYHKASIIEMNETDLNIKRINGISNTESSNMNLTEALVSNEIHTMNEVENEAEKDVCYESGISTLSETEKILNEISDSSSSGSQEIKSHVSEQANLSSQSSDISEIWHKHLFWPSTASTKSKIKKETEKLPCVITGNKWREYKLKKKIEQEEKELQAQEKKKQRKIKIEQTELMKQKMKEERKIKMEEKAKIKEEKLKLKKENAENRLNNKKESQKKVTKNNATVTRKRKALEQINVN